MARRLREPHFESIVEAGLLAPSADNRHFIQFEHTEDGIAFWADGRFMPAPYHRKVLSLIGFGAAAENMLLRAKSLGYEGRLHTRPEADQPTLLARINFEPAVPADCELESAIVERHTNRAFFRGPRLAELPRKRLHHEVDHIAGAALHWFDDSESRRRIAHIVRLAESARFQREALHGELFSSIRFDVGWERSSDEGLPPGALGIERPFRAAFSSLRHWPLMRRLNILGAHRLIGMRAGYLPCRLAPHVVALSATSKADVTEACWAVGRALERFWLRATTLGLALQPFAAPGLFALEGYEEIPTNLRRQLEKRWAELVTGALPLIVCRMGVAAAPTVRGGRRRVEQHVRCDRRLGH